MNKKGFTLIELLGVLVILALLASLTTLTVTNIVKKSKTELSELQLSSIKSAAQIWGEENVNKLPESGECIYITLKNIQTAGLLDEDVVDPGTTKKISDNLKIKITARTNSKGKRVLNYEVGVSDTTGCSYPSSCEIISGDINTYGSEVKCDDQYFYVIPDHEISEDRTVSLLAKKNITLPSDLKLENPVQSDETTTISFSDSKYWEGVENGTFVYDENSNIYDYVDAYQNYLSNSLGGVSLTATLPSYNQMIGLGCVHDSDPAYEYSCEPAPSWVYSTSYWTGSFMEEDDMWYVEDGAFGDSSVSGNRDGNHAEDDLYGVRPVVIISKTEFYIP